MAKNKRAGLSARPFRHNRATARTKTQGFVVLQFCYITLQKGSQCLSMKKRLKKFCYPEDMDAECVQLCDFFNSIGMKTKYSDCGHGESPFYIMFSDDVTDKKIARFVKKLSKGKTHTPCCGRFLCWVRSVNGRMTKTWEYQCYGAVKKGSHTACEMANYDLECFISAFTKGGFYDNTKDN